MINKNKLQKLNNKELQEIVYKKINRIERLNYDLNVRKCGGSLSRLINLNDKDGETLLEEMDYFLDNIRNEHIATYEKLQEQELEENKKYCDTVDEIKELEDEIEYNCEAYRDEMYELSNNEMIDNYLNKNQLIDFIEQLDDYIYQIIEDFRNYQEYKNNEFLDY